MKFEDIITKASQGSEYQLSSSERATMDRVVREYVAMKPLPSSQSYSISLSYSWFAFAHRPIAAVLVLVLIFGSGVSYAAENALPGDALYAVKTYINEPTKVALATNAEAKAEVQIELAERRIEEAAILAAEGRLDTSTEDDLAVAFESHASAAAEHIAEAETDDSGASIELASRFENRLAAHETILAEVENSDESEHSARLASAIRAASENAINISIGNALALAIDTAEDTALMATSEGAAPKSDTETTMESATMATMSVASDTPAPTVEARSAKMTTVAAPASTPGHTSSPAGEARDPASAPGASGLAKAHSAFSPDAKTISRMKAAAEKSLKNAQKKFKSAKSLSAEARTQAETDIALADSLLSEGSQHLEADADAEAYAAFKESSRVSEQTSVYIKAAPVLEKVRSRAKNSRAHFESRLESHGIDATVEVGPLNVTTTPAPVENKEDEEEPRPKPENGTSGSSTNTDVKIKLDLSL